MSAIARLCRDADARLTVAAVPTTLLSNQPGYPTMPAACSMRISWLTYCSAWRSAAWSMAAKVLVTGLSRLP